MSSKNTFEGLQFRILETLEKQPGQAPLTAMEIASRLHDTEYRTEMLDNVNFKVTRAVHSMKELGKIVVADARDSQGRLTYQLPHRLKFPPSKSNTPPANPVLKPEQAALIKTVEKVEPERSASSKVPVYVPGILDKIVDQLDTSPHPLTSLDLVEIFRAQYATHVKDENRLKMIMAGNLHHLSKIVRRINRRPIKGNKSGGKGARFEYFTRRTGAEPRPGEPTVAEVQKPVVDAKQQRAVVVEVKKPVAAKPKATGGFRPVKVEELVQEIKLQWPPEQFQRIADMAKTFGVSVEDFCKQAIDYAVAHAEGAE